jgi:hypothetical protein
MKYVKPTKEKLEKIKKINGAGPGSYKYDECIRKVNWSSIENKFGREKQICFVDKVSNNKKHVPGSGHYKEFEKSFDKQSKLPTSLRRAR